jgi:RNA polymerase sigma-70 factor (ECF subfamily)
MTMHSTAEARLLERLLRRDENALREVIDQHGPAVLGMSRRILGDPARAEEIAQDTFVALWRRPGAFDPDRGKLRNFLLGVARNKSVDLVRKEEAARRRTVDLLPVPALNLDRLETDAADDRATISSALSTLSPVQREAIVLAYFGGLTYREVAGRLGIPEGTAKTRLRDALTRLRGELGSLRGEP